MNWQYYYIISKDLVGRATDFDENSQLFIDGKWVDDQWHIIADRIIGYDGEEIGAGSMLFDIEEITEDEAKRRRKKKPALVKFIGNSKEYNNQVITGNEYLAFFLEHWGEKRNNLHILDESGEVNYWYKLEDFEILNDSDNVLNDLYAMVRCIKELPENDSEAPRLDKDYKAIAKRKTDGYYLLQDESGLDYFYPPEMFEVLSDLYGVLKPYTSIIVYDFENRFDI